MVRRMPYILSLKRAQSRPQATMSRTQEEATRSRRNVPLQRASMPDGAGVASREDARFAPPAATPTPTRLLAAIGTGTGKQHSHIPILLDENWPGQDQDHRVAEPWHHLRAIKEQQQQHSGSDSRASSSSAPTEASLVLGSTRLRLDDLSEKTSASQQMMQGCASSSSRQEGSGGSHAALDDWAAAGNSCCPDTSRQGGELACIGHWVEERKGKLRQWVGNGGE